MKLSKNNNFSFDIAPGVGVLRETPTPVSYTHLTLPTSDLV